MGCTTAHVRNRRPFAQRFFLLGVLFSLAAACSDDGETGAPNTSGSGPVAGTSGASGTVGGTAGAAGSASGGSTSGMAGSAGTGAGTGGGVGSAGSAGSSMGGSAGSGGGETGPVKPVLRDGRWALELGEVTMEVDPAVGARIVTFKLGTENLLTGPAVNPLYYGSTLWTSPETQWMQPPPAPIDSAPYTVEASDTKVTMTGGQYDMLGVSVTKTFSADKSRNAFVIEYELTNHKQTEIMMAPWEVTRVLPRGLTFYPTGSKMMLSAGATMPTTNSGGVTWYQYDMAAVTKDSKIFADGAEGWVAHIAAGIVFIKKFPDVAPEKIAPNEGDVELYTNALHTYVEIEDQAAYGPIAAGASVSWKVEWFLRRLPAAIEAKAGNAALTQFVRDTIK